MASKTPKRAQEIRDLARALCIRAWLDTNWSEKTVYSHSSHSSVTVGDSVESVWLAFPCQGLSLSIRFSSSLSPENPKHRDRCSGNVLVQSYSPPGYSRIEQIWWNMAVEQKSFSGMNLLNTCIELLVHPSEEASAWAEEILAPYGIPPESGVYQVTLHAPASAEKVFIGTFNSEAEARDQAIQNIKGYGWHVIETGEAKIVGVKKTK